MGLGVQRYRRRCLKLVGLVIEVWKMVCKKKVLWQHNCNSRGFVDFFFSPTKILKDCSDFLKSFCKRDHCNCFVCLEEKTDVFYASNSLQSCRELEKKCRLYKHLQKNKNCELTYDQSLLFRSNCLWFYKCDFYLPTFFL